MNLEQLTEFMGWCLLVNGGLFLFSSLGLMFFREQAASLHSKIFDLEVEEIKKLYFNYLAFYKIIFICFNLVPYIALKIMQ